jgi:uncharacterized lipoprotein YmbA
MIRATALLAFAPLLLAACAGTQTRQAFSLRPAAAPELHAEMASNSTVERERALADAIERSLRAQEDADDNGPAAAAKVDVKALVPPAAGSEPRTVQR